MTSNTQLVRVPRELLERIEFLLLSAGAQQMCVRELHALLAAPAEDVRAVVDEPVAYVPESALNVLADVGWIHVFKSPGNGGAAVPLYRKPQRLVVFPSIEEYFEKWWEEDGQYCRAGGGGYEKSFAYAAFKACLDAVEELNK